MKVGKRTKFWHQHLSNIGDCEIGEDCIIHSHTWIGDSVVIGNRVKIEAFAFIPPGVVIEDDCFIGPRVTFTNDRHPPSTLLTTTLVKKGASLGASVTIICGVTIGENAFIGAGSLVTKNIPDGETWYGVPARKH